jgi:CubicO group peptidase (beta-lactamase class C family)
MMNAARSVIGLAAVAKAACLLALTGAPTMAHAQPAPMPPTLTNADATAWLDGLMPYALKAAEIPGAEVAIVKDGQVLLEKGYGSTDAEDKTPIHPTRTLVRPGSISKLFVWTAVMQLAETGKLDIDGDINSYLDFVIPAYRGKPITLRNIMTQSSGFEETERDLIVTNPSRFVPLETALKRFVPRRIFDPGTVPGYSNYASALAGYIVQRISGEPFADYVEHHIFQPLGMVHSTFVQPLPANLRPDMSPGYDTSSQAPEGFEYISLAPAGALSTTADDMTRFMIAHLQDGRFGNAQILRPETARMMHSTITRFLPPLNGMAIGFAQSDINGRRIISHGGDTVYFHSGLWLWLDDGIGLFVSMNANGTDGAAARIRRALFAAFADRYLPGLAVDASIDGATAIKDANLIAGHYLSTRRAESTFSAGENLFGQFVIAAGQDGTVYAAGKNFHEIAPLLWREQGGHETLAALVKDGHVTRVSLGDYAFVGVFQPAPLLLSAAWIEPAGLAALIALTCTVLTWPSAALTRRHYRQPFALNGWRAGLYRSTRLVGVAALCAIAGWIWLSSALSDTDAPNLDWAIHSIQGLTALGWPGGLAIAVANVATVWHSPGSWFARLWSLVLVLSFAVLAWIGVAFGLIGFSANY